MIVGNMNMRWMCVAALATVFACAAHAKLDVEVERDELQQRLVAQFQKGDFAQMDDDAESSLRTRVRMKDGLRRLWFLHHLLADELSKQVADSAAFAKTQAQLVKLARSRPKSQNAWLMVASARQSLAWHKRGSKGFASTVPPGGFEAFRKEMLEVTRLLDEHKRTLARNPEWHVARIAAATYLGEGTAKVDDLFTEGTAVDATYPALYFSRIHHSTPQWRGSVDAMVDFMNSTIKPTSHESALPLYAWTAWYAENSGWREVLESPKLDWPLMKRSMAIILREHTTDWNAQKFLVWACTRPDGAEMRRIAQMVTQPASERALTRDLAVFRQCLEVAQGKSVGFVLRDKRTGKEVFIN